MDRFIADIFHKTYEKVKGLKSNMDRFIVIEHAKVLPPRKFKIQYG